MHHDDIQPQTCSAVSSNTQRIAPAVVPVLKVAIHRLTRYKLRSLMALVFIMCLCLARVSESARRQRAAVKAIEATGGQIEYAHERRGLTPPGPAILRQLLGKEFFWTVVGVQGQRDWGKGIGGDALRFVSVFSHLEDLNVEGTGAERRLFVLENLQNLRRLTLQRVPMTPDALTYVKGLRTLEELKLWHCGVNNETLAALSSMAELRDLDIRGLPALGQPGITDDGLRHLQRSEALNALSISEQNLNGEGLKYIERLPTLKVLELDGPNLDERHLEHLNPHLTVLQLGFVRMTNIGLESIARLPQLRSFYTVGGTLPPNAKKILAGLPPGCKVRLDWRALQQPDDCHDAVLDGVQQ